MGKSQDLYKKAKELIPGGTQLLSKRPEMFLPDIWPAYYSKAKGCEVWDEDSQKYIDMSYMGIGSCVLGYADEDVNEAVLKAVKDGSMSTLNCPEEVELAELLIEMHPWADMVRYARTGGEAMAISVRIARTHASKSKILFCGYHGWHDWYLAANIADDKSLDGHLLPGLSPAGVVRELKGSSMPFKYNDIEQFRFLIKKHSGDIAAVVMEPIRNFYPEKEFLEEIRDITAKEKIVLIFDEITSGFRLYPGGAHLKFGVLPDVAVFAKGMSNGYPMAAIIGVAEVMESAQSTFISSTYWTERIGPSAALACLRKIIDKNVTENLIKTGRKVQEGWKESSAECGIDITISGIYPLGHFSFNHEKPLVLKTLFTQFMLEKGFLATNSFYASYAHKNRHLQAYLKALRPAFSFLESAVKSETPEQYLKGPVCHGGFRRLT